jgi:hypothetical protein
MNEWGDMDQRTHLAMHERMEEKQDAILEYVKDIPVMKADIRWLRINIRELRSILKADTPHVKGRLDKLEAH